ncbi:MAG TPA: alpha/beta hydrolase [Lacunisphaera sp.]|nr:alpha/beta hydrolase [Lacunisphaera sp.]
MKRLLLVLFAGATIAAAAEPAPPYGNNPAAGMYHEVRGIRLYCETYGHGQPVLMIHGNGGSIESFKENIGYFAAKYRVIAADSRAQGKSRDDGDALTFEMMADDFAALLDELHIAKAYVVGFSDGGITALLLAMRHPEKVMRLAATGANLRPEASAFAPGVWEEDRKRYERDHARAWNTAKERNDWKLFLLDWREPNIPAAALQRVTCPALIICGDHDLISLEHTVEIYRSLPHAALWIVPNSGHATLREHADDFNRVVDGFFNSAHPTAH